MKLKNAAIHDERAQATGELPSVGWTRCASKGRCGFILHYLANVKSDDNPVKEMPSE
jgi:hypothetical protein